MDLQTAVDALRLFNEKAAKLEGLSFTKRVFSERSGVSLYFRQGEGFRRELHGPDEEAREAMLLTLRFFVQDNELSSFRNLAEAYRVLPIGTTLSAEYHDLRRQVNEFLDDYPPLRIQIGSYSLRNRDIFEVFLYGHHAHANPEKRRKFERWKRNPTLHALTENEFIHMLMILLRAIFAIRDVNAQALEELKARQT